MTAEGIPGTMSFDSSANPVSDEQDEWSVEAVTLVMGMAKTPEERGSLFMALKVGFEVGVHHALGALAHQHPEIDGMGVTVKTAFTMIYEDGA